MSACQLDFLRDNGYIKPTEDKFDTFAELQEFILPKYVRCDNPVIAFDLDNEPIVISTNYIVAGMEKLINSKYTYYVDTITGIFVFKNHHEGSQILVNCKFESEAIDIIDGTDFIIKLDDVWEYTHPVDLKQKVWVEFSLRYRNRVYASIVLEDVPVLEEGNYEEYYSDVCNMLLENLVVIK